MRDVIILNFDICISRKYTLIHDLSQKRKDRIFIQTNVP